MDKPHLKPFDEFFIANTKPVSLFWLLLHISHFSETAEENCVEENHTEPDHSDDSVRVKIADLGNACWVVSHVHWPGKQPLLLSYTPFHIYPSLFQAFRLLGKARESFFEEMRFSQKIDTPESVIVRFFTRKVNMVIFIEGCLGHSRSTFLLKLLSS